MRIIRLYSPPNEIATPINLRVLVDGKQLSGVTKVTVHPIDANKPDVVMATIETMVGLDITVEEKN